MKARKRRIDLATKRKTGENPFHGKATLGIQSYKKSLEITVTTV